MESYRKYPYAHYSLGSRPVINNEIIDRNVGKLLDLITNTPDITTEQLKHIQDVIQEKIKQKETFFLVPSENENKKESSKRVSFTASTKKGGKNKRKKNNKTKRRKH